MPTNPSLAATGPSPTQTDVNWHEFDADNEATWPPYGSLVLARGPAGGHFLGYFHHDWWYYEEGDEWLREYPRISSMDDSGWRTFVAYAVVQPSIIVPNNPPDGETT